MIREDGSTRLVLVRHGETVGKSSIRYFGRTDVELSELGRAQMRAAASWLAARTGVTSFSPVFASPLKRASEGARIIAGAMSATVTIDEFVEVDFGLFEGLTADEIRARHPLEFERWNDNRLADGYAYPGGESRAAFTARVERGVERMLAVLDGAVASAQDGAVAPAQDGADTTAPYRAPVPAPDGAGTGALVSASEQSRVVPRSPAIALVVAHRGVIRAITRRLAAAEPEIELGSIQVLTRAGRRAGWRAGLLDATEHLRGL
jgi:broad specificity phosphatase PhoE